jgi:hypothetical protein
VDGAPHLGQLWGIGSATYADPIQPPARQVVGVFAEGASEEDAQAMRAVADARPACGEADGLSRQGLAFAQKIAEADHLAKRARSEA